MMQGLRRRISGATGQREAARSERGAIMMLIAVFAGAGVLLAVMAMGIETGRVYLMRNQVQSAGDSAVGALAQQCKGKVFGVSTQCTSAHSLFRLATSSVGLAGTGADAVRVVGVCVETSTATQPGVLCATSSAGPDNADNPGTLDDACSPIPFGTKSYVQLVVERVTPFAGLFMPSTNFRQCVQVKWSIGYTESVVAAFMFPACGFSATEWVLLEESVANGVGGGTNATSSCTADWGGTFGTVTYGNAITLGTGIDPSGLDGSPACGDTAQVTLPTTLTTGRTIDSICANEKSKGNVLPLSPTVLPKLYTWLSGTAQWVPIGGDYVADPDTNWRVQVVAFAKFDLFAYNNNEASTWQWRSGYSASSLPTSVQTLLANSKCATTNKLVCLVGKYVPGTLEYAGSDAAPDGIEFLP